MKNRESKTDLLTSYSVLSGFASFVPVPFLDDYLLGRIRKSLVRRLLKRGESPISLLSVKEIYAGPSKGWLVSAVGFVLIPVKKILKKLLRTFFFFLAVRRASLDSMETYLLGRAIERSLEKGLLLVQGSAEAEVPMIRSAFEAAARGADRHLLVATTRKMWKSLRSMLPDFTAFRRLRSSREGSEEIIPEALSGTSQEVLLEGQRRFEKVLESDEMKLFLYGFDSRFDEALAASRTKSNS